MALYSNRITMGHSVTLPRPHPHFLCGHFGHQVCATATVLRHSIGQLPAFIGLPPKQQPYNISTHRSQFLNITTTKASKENSRSRIVDMAELVPDAWQPPDDDAKCCHQQRRAPKRGPITDILLWVECFSVMAGI